MPVSCHFRGCRALLRIVKLRYIKYHVLAFFLSVLIYTVKRMYVNLFVTSDTYSLSALTRES